MARSYPLLLVAATATLLFVLITGLASTAWVHENPSTRVETRSPSENQRPLFKPFKAPRKNVWADLSRTEADDLTAWLLRPGNPLNVTDVGSAGSRSNSIFLIEALAPNKSDAVPYLESSSVSLPPRYARVVISERAAEEPRFAEYTVQLPLDKDSELVPLTFRYNADRNYIPQAFPDIMALSIWFNEAIKDSVMDILSDLLGDALGMENGNLQMFMLAARLLRQEGDRTMLWTSVHSPSDAWSLLPQGLYVSLDTSAADESNWKLDRWYYNGILYPNTAAFRKAWESPDFEKVAPNYDGTWTEPQDFTKNEEREMPPPYAIQPAGGRFQLDEEQRYVSWMGFTFYFSTRGANGVAVHDIRFRGERVMHELGLQEALAHYAGANPMQSGQVWLDTFFGMGLRLFEMVPGYDCPAYATYLNTEFNVLQNNWTNPNSICLFEHTSDYPLQRHTTDHYVSISRNTYLILRGVSTVGNYDYTIDYLFYLDGTIEVKFRASGYIFSAYFDGPAAADPSDTPIGEDEYGYRVHDVVSGSMHDHVLNFKADLDIAGEPNTLVTVDVAPVTKKYTWDAGPEGPRNTMHLITTPVVQETHLDWPSNARTMYLVLNNASTNAWGEKRGYRIAPGTGVGTPPHLTIHESTALSHASHWAEHDLFVVKQHDTEPRSAHEMNFASPESPLIDFSRFLNDEPTVQEDLVVFFNLGTHHVPHAGDIPNTLEHTASSSVMFIPHNFHDRDPSRRTAQGVTLTLDPAKGAGTKERRYWGGRHQGSLKMEEGELEPDLSKYLGVPHGVTPNRTLLGAEEDERKWVGMGAYPG